MSGERPDGAGTDGGPLRRRAAGFVATARATYALAVETEVSLLAAAIAYYAFVSMVPLVVLGVAVATTVGGDALADRLLALAGDLLAPTGETLLRSAVTARTGLGGVTLVGLLVLLWGALKAFRAMDRAFSLLYDTRASSSLSSSLADAVVALVAVGGATLVMLAAGAAVALLPGPLVGPIGALALFLTLVVVFLPLYYLFPDAWLSLREVVPGAVLAALCWTALGAAFQFYAATVADASIYGLLGAVILGLTWLYLGSLVLLLGAAVNAVRSDDAPVPYQ